MRQKRDFYRFSTLFMDEGWINLTPLIDVIFVILVAFILIAPLLEVDQIDLANAPESSEKNWPEKAEISIYVREDNSIWINRLPIKEMDLLKCLKECKRQYPHQIPSLFQDSQAKFGTYQTVKNAVEAAGFDQLNIFLKPKE